MEEWKPTSATPAEAIFTALCLSLGVLEECYDHLDTAPVSRIGLRSEVRAALAAVRLAMPIAQGASDAGPFENWPLGHPLRLSRIAAELTQALGGWPETPETYERLRMTVARSIGALDRIAHEQRQSAVAASPTVQPGLIS